MWPPVFGSDPRGARLERIRLSPNYRDGVFQNGEVTSVMRQDASYRRMLKEYLIKPRDNVPAKPLPSIKTDLRTLHGEKPTLVWFGTLLVSHQISARHDAG